MLLRSIDLWDTDRPKVKCVDFREARGFERGPRAFSFLGRDGDKDGGYTEWCLT